MARTWSATDGFHWASDSMMEQFGNAANYNVVDGCAASYSGSNLNVTVASGVITHNGTQVTVPGNTVALVADGSNPRFTWVAINSSGVAVIVSGTPAADPTEPEVGDNVEVALVKVAAGGTIASSQTANDRRLFAARDSETDANGLDSDVTSLNSTILANVTGLSAAVAANSTYAFRALINYYAAAANDYKFGFTVPASATIHAIVEYTNTSGSQVLGNLTSSGGSLTATGFGATTAGTVVIHGAVITAGTAGDLQFQHAQGTAGATVTTLEKSRLEVF